jgi:DNA ligase (NAD+)
VVGENITSKILSSTFKGLPFKVSEERDFEVRGEIYITDNDFVKAQEGRKKAGGAPFANPRNAAAGSLRTDNDTSYVPFSFSAYEVLGLPQDSYLERINEMSELGFGVAVNLVPVEVNKLDKISDRITFIGKVRENFGFPTDGVVLKYDSTVVRKELGEGTRAPKWGVAYKFEASDAKRTVVRGIETSVGRTGRVAFRAKVDPVNVDGSTISYASLHNVSWIENMDVRIGDTVVIAKANDIIPQILEVVKTERDGSEKRWVAPTVCPNCGEPFDKSTLLWRCTSNTCSVAAKIVYAVSRPAWRIEFMSDAIVEALVDAGDLNNVADVFDLTKEKLASLKLGVTSTGADRVLGEKVAAKIMDEIEFARKNATFAQTITALGLRGTGRAMSKRLVESFPTVRDLMKASVDDFMKVEGVAENKAKLIYSELQENKAIIKKLFYKGLQMSEKVAKASNVLAGKKVVVTGSMAGSKLDGLTRDGMVELIEKNGGVFSSAVSSSTSILVCADQTSSKAVKAKQLGTVDIMSPNEFANKIGM